MVGRPTSVAMSLSSSADAPAQARRQRGASPFCANAPSPAPARRVVGGPRPHARLHLLRRPETGLSHGQGPHLGQRRRSAAGEMTATRAAVRLESGEVGIGYVGGRSARHAEIGSPPPMPWVMRPDRRGPAWRPRSWRHWRPRLLTRRRAHRRPRRGDQGRLLHRRPPERR